MEKKLFIFYLIMIIITQHCYINLSLIEKTESDKLS